MAIAKYENFPGIGLAIGSGKILYEDASEPQGKAYPFPRISKNNRITLPFCGGEVLQGEGAGEGRRESIQKICNPYRMQGWFRFRFR